MALSLADSDSPGVRRVDGDSASACSRLSRSHEGMPSKVELKDPSQHAAPVHTSSKHPSISWACDPQSFPSFSIRVAEDRPSERTGAFLGGELKLKIM